jgi:hypothetical protein
MMVSRALLITLLVSGPSLAFAQGTTAPSVDGIWKIEANVVTGANAATVSPQASLVIFARGYYSLMSVYGTQPRQATARPKDLNHLTDAEKIARYEEWNPVTAQAGTYDIEGTTMTRRPLVAKNAALMTNPSIVQEFKLEGDTLWLISKSGPGQPASEARLKLTRVR